MSDVWYFALNSEPVGPLTQAQLIERLPRAEDALVWQSGLPDWRKVSEFSDLLPYVVKPPPLPPRPPPLPRRLSASPLAAEPRLIREPSVSADDAAQFKRLAADPAGISGWLALVAVGQVLGPLRLLVWIGQYYEKMDKRVLESFPVAFWGEAVLNALLFSLAVYTAVLFFRHSRKFPTLFIWQWIAVVTLPFIDAAWVAVSIGAYTGKSPSEFLKLEPEEIGQSIAYTILGGIWVAYILKSKRVANTFIK